MRPVVDPAAIKIGVLGDLSGTDPGMVGDDVASGARLAVDQYNAARRGPRVQLVPYDSGGRSAAEVGLVQQIVADGSVAVVDAGSTAEAHVADPLLEQADIANVTPLAGDASLSARGWKYWHRTVAADDLEGPVEAEWLIKSLHASSVAVIDDRSDYGLLTATTVRQIVASAGVLTTIDSIDTKSVDYSTLVTKLAAKPPDAIFYGGYGKDLGPLVTQLRAGGVGAPIVSDAAAVSDEVLAGPNGHEFDTFAMCSCTLATAEPAAAAFVAAFRAANGTAPGPWAMDGYDATNVILTALARGARTTAAVEAALQPPATFAGVTHALRFASDGVATGATIQTYRAQSGHFVLVAR